MIKTEMDSDEKAKALKAKLKLEREYIVERFYEIGNLTVFWSLFMTAYSLLQSSSPGTRYEGAVGAIYWALYFGLRKRTDRYKGTKDAEGAMNQFRDMNGMLGSITQVAGWTLSLSTGEVRGAATCTAVLVGYYLSIAVNRIHAPRCRDHYPLVTVVVLPLAALRFPRFGGVVEPRDEALAFFVACGLGEIVGGVLDGLRWRRFEASAATTRRKAE